MAAPTQVESELASASSGAIIAKAVPSGPNQGSAGPSEYEIKTTYRLTASGGNYVTYFRASADAHLNPYGASTGTTAKPCKKNFYLLSMKVLCGPGYDIVREKRGVAWREQ